MRKETALLAAAIVGLGLAAFGMRGNSAAKSDVGTHPGGIQAGELKPLKPKGKDQLAAFSGGCFWGTEYFFRHVKGVVATAVGYTGGYTDNPTYELVSSHTTGHAETVLLEFDPALISYKQLVHQFWVCHDPTTMNRQGPDEGTNYRSAIWTMNDEQAKEAKASLDEEQKHESAPITTTIAPMGKFWLAEDYHQQYDEKTGTNTCPPPRNIGW